MFPDALVFVGGAILVGGVVHVGIPALSAATGMDGMAAWMLLSVPLVFTPIIVAGLLLLRSEPDRPPWVVRLRLQGPSKQDWAWGLMGLLGVGVGSGVMFLVCNQAGLDTNPPFARHLQPMTGERLWMFFVWLVYWPINILGENLVWRAIILPRMEQRLGRTAWAWNAALWGVFHTAFGLGNLLVLLPSLLGVPFVSQKRKNTWLAVLLHAGLSGPGFVALALGLV